MGHHQAHPRSLLSTRDVDRRDTTPTNRGADDEPVERLAGLPMLVGIGRASGHLERAVDAAHCLSNDRHHACSACCVASVSVRTSARLASSILKSLCPRPIAPASAASAAARNCAVVAGCPISAACASAERHGLGATPPSATRALVIVPPCVSITSATETSANSEEARSPTLP